MTLEQILEKLNKEHRHLIPNTFSDKAYMSLYFAHSSNYDLKYLGVDFSTLLCVTDDLDRLEQIVSVVCYGHEYKWQKLYDVNQLEYNPIWNVDGVETETHEIAGRKTTDKYGKSIVDSKNSEVPDDMTNEKETAKNETTRQAYDDVHEEDGYTDIITKERSGNIGVTMTQQLIEAERRISDFDLTDIIMRDIIKAIAIPYFGG